MQCVTVHVEDVCTVIQGHRISIGLDKTSLEGRKLLASSALTVDYSIFVGGSHVTETM